MLALRGDCREQLLSPFRDDLARGAVPSVIEYARIVGGLEIELAGSRAETPGDADEARGRVHRTGRADGNEQVGVLKRLLDRLHVQRHFAEPDDIRPERSNGAAIGAAVGDTEVLPPVSFGGTKLAADPKQFTVHVHDLVRAGALMQIVNVLGDEGHVMAISG